MYDYLNPVRWFKVIDLYHLSLSESDIPCDLAGVW
jgi:hypothetical protein